MTDGPGIRRSNHVDRHGWTVLTVAETGSTNADLLAAVERDEIAVPTALRADHQTAGRGRLDRRWDAPAGSNLLASLCFLDVPADPAELTQAVGLAAVLAVDELRETAARPGDRASSDVGLKWPNDVLVGDVKLAGVLAQRSVRGPVVVGIGLNVAWAPDGAASLHRDLGVETSPDALLHDLLVHVDRLLDLTSAQRRERYVSRLHTIGRVVRIEMPRGGDLVGLATGLDERGRLTVDVDGEIHQVDVGDIVHLRTPPIDQ